MNSSLHNLAPARHVETVKKIHQPKSETEFWKWQKAMSVSSCPGDLKKAKVLTRDPAGGNSLPPKHMSDIFQKLSRYMFNKESRDQKGKIERENQSGLVTTLDGRSEKRAPL